MHKLFSTKNCPKCEQVKSDLKNKRIEFSEVDMSTPESLTELSVNGVFTLSAPVLQIDEKFYTSRDLFKENTLITLTFVGDV